MASSLHGIPRFTQDVNFAARLTPDADALVKLLESSFHVDADMICNAILHRSSFDAIYLPTMTKADVFVPDESEWRQQEWHRRVTAPVGDEGSEITVYFASADDTVLQKLLWYRLTGERSDRQWGDVQGVLKVQAGALDGAYLMRWAHELNIAGLFAQALDDAGLSLPTTD